MPEEINHNDAEEIAPSTVDKQAPDVSEDNAPSTDSDVATNIPTANAPDPASTNPEVNPNAAGEKSSTAASTPDDSAQVQPNPKKTAQVPKEDKPAAKAAAAKKEKAPAVEDKPFMEFIQQDYLPALKTALEKTGVQDLELKLEKRSLQEVSDCWQVYGSWQGGKRQFNVYFPEQDIQKQRAFSCYEGSKPSTIEPFLCDERKITLDLLVFGVTQRLNAQKWLTRN
ncbi:DUF2996 domain-containing protein [Trichocoleus sp. FACHB-90]|uniref:DUF2996 domain-containing protein n=1 Tax=Cyanophyceae TaxID=3028117 RepID=UPI0016858ECF|nr:DUF2996 domain-containing protein [Trichocoleus sp. FACHB-90]MBD1929332.1 DUF2996 domain-containing protein [Trichocoleus sp. FACHB-90]